MASEQGEELRVMFLSEDARAPARSSPGAAGYDLFSSKTTTITAHNRGIVDTDIAVAIPVGLYGRVAPRSGLAVRDGLDTGAGVIDSDYRGHVRVVLFNHSDKEVVLPKHSRVAQLILERIATPPVRVVTSLDDTERGAAGFGSTGL